MDRYTKSREYLERAKKVTPGAAQTLSKMPARFPFGAFPIFAADGLGANLYDIDGNKFVDWICGLASITLGYGNLRVTKAIQNQLIKGINFSLPTKLEAEVAERLCSVFPCAQEGGSARFLKSGSEANEGAIRIARRATGRDIIVTVGSGYHSWHSWAAAYKPWHPGVPKQYEDLVRTFNYNDSTSLLSVLGSDVALVILEPACHEKTDSEFLQRVVNESHAVGALVCFDEVVCAGRWALGGGQEYFGVTPDFCTAGKGLANGMPLACIAGPRELLKYADLVSGTFGGEALSLAAANAVLDVYESEPVIKTMWKRGEQLQNFFNRSAEARELKGFAVCDGYPCKPRFRFACNDRQTNELAMSLFLQVAAEYGALFHPGGLNCCYALTDDDMCITQQAITKGLDAVDNAIELGDWSTLKGNIIQPVVTVRS